MRKMVWVGKEGSKGTYDTHAFGRKAWVPDNR